MGWILKILVISRSILGKFVLGIEILDSRFSVLQTVTTANPMYQLLQGLYDALTNLDAKDRFTLAASIVALCISALTYIQRANESRLALRKQLTDLIQKLSDLEMDVARIGFKTQDYPIGYVGFMTDQRRFLVHQADYVVRQIKGLASPYEFVVIAKAFDAFGEVDRTDRYFDLAARSGSPLDRGIATRSHARILFNQGRHEEARAKYLKAADYFLPGSSDTMTATYANTYERWALQEREWGNEKEADRLLRIALEQFARITKPSFRAKEINRVRASLIDDRTMEAERATEELPPSTVALSTTASIPS